MVLLAQYTVQVREEFTQGIAVAASVTKQILEDEQQERDIYIDISANPSHKNCSDRRVTIVRNHKDLERLNGNVEQRNKAQMESLSKTKRRRAGVRKMLRQEEKQKRKAEQKKKPDVKNKRKQQQNPEDPARR